MHSQIIRKQGQSEGQVGHLEIWWQGFNLGPEMPCDMLAVTQLMITGGEGVIVSSPPVPFPFSPGASAFT